MTTPQPRPVPVERSARATPYIPQSPPPHVDLFLDANESPAPAVDLAALAARLGPDAARRYSSPAPLEAALARRLGVAPDRVLVTAGGDQAIDLACRAFLEPGRRLLLPSPSFEMITKYALLAGAAIDSVPWATPEFPVDAVRDALSPRTAMLAVVSPNNPTGAVVTPDQLRAVARVAAERAPTCLIMVDLAYAEFAKDDLTSVALDLPNALAIRTFSKAFGLAGLRVGYALGDPSVIRALRATTSPFPVARLALAAAQQALADLDAGPNSFVPRLLAQVSKERDALARALAQPRDPGRRAIPRPSQANFLLLDFPSPDAAHAVHADLLARGIAVRKYPPTSDLARCLRVTCPGRQDWFDRLLQALAAIGVASPDTKGAAR